MYRLCCVYKPPDVNVEYVKLMCEWIESNCDRKTPCIIVGDFNFPSFDWKNLVCPQKEAYSIFRDCILECDLSQLISEPTFGQNILDLVLCTDPHVVLETEVLCGFSTSTVNWGDFDTAG